MNDLDDWLNSMGINSPVEDSSEGTNSSGEQTDIPLELRAPWQERTSPAFTVDDINDVLAENGFNIQAPFEEDGGNTDEYDENDSEGRDLDAEEDRDWDRLEAQREVSPVEFDPLSVADPAVHFHMPNGEVIDVPIVYEDNVSQAVQDVNENYPVHNPDEEVSQDTIEAFLAVTEQQELQAETLPLTPNSPTLLINETTSRFSGTEWYNEIQKSRIILAGLGGIGSWVAIQLARMNPATLFLYDDDIVERANMSGQLYCKNDIGKAKVDAMTDMIKSYTTMRNIYAIREKFTQDCEAGDIMICGFDNMMARHVFYRKWAEHLRNKPENGLHKCIFLDGRLSIDCLQVFCITGDNTWAMDEYTEKYLFTDAEAEETQCSLKQTTYLASMIGSVIVNLFTNWVANTLNPVIPYDLPFFTEYDAKNMIFKTIK